MKKAMLTALIVLVAATLNAQQTARPKVNINAATLAQLEYLPGIGKLIAQRIVDYRIEHGQFRQVSDLLQVKGIGQKKLAAMQPFVALSGATTATRKIRPCSVNETGAQCQARVGNAAEVIFYPASNLNLIEAR